MQIATRIFIAMAAIMCYIPSIADAQPAALAELFSSFGCGNCTVPDNAYDVYLSKHPGVVVIHYHNTTADPNDEFFHESYPASQDRDNFYGGGGAQNDPTASIDGYPLTIPESNWEAASNVALTNTLPTSITSEVGNGPNGIDTISFTISGGPSGKQVAYYVAIKESKIYYANTEAYGNPPDSLWNDIFRAMLPNGNGSSTFALGGTRHFTEIFDPSLYQFTGNQQNMTAVIFVQDKVASAPKSYQIEGLDTVSLASPEAVYGAGAQSDQLIFPENPLSANGEFRLELSKAGDVQISVYDLLGREIRTLVSGTMPAGETTVDLNGASFPAGVYVARLSVDGRTVDQKKFVTQ